MARNRTFLVVDDSEDNRVLAQHALTRAFPGARVVGCGSTEAALATAAGATFDGVVTDHHLGTATGASFLRELRARGVACPIVMVTASLDPRVHERACEAGAARVFADIDGDFVRFFRELLPEERQ